MRKACDLGCGRRSTAIDTTGRPSLCRPSHLISRPTRAQRQYRMFQTHWRPTDYWVAALCPDSACGSRSDCSVTARFRDYGRCTLRSPPAEDNLVFAPSPAPRVSADHRQSRRDPDDSARGPRARVASRLRIRVISLTQVVRTPVHHDRPPEDAVGPDQLDERIRRRASGDARTVSCDVPPVPHVPDGVLGGTVGLPVRVEVRTTRSAAVA